MFPENLSTGELEAVRSFSFDEMSVLPIITRQDEQHEAYQEGQNIATAYLSSYLMAKRRPEKLEGQKELEHWATQVLITKGEIHTGTLYTLHGHIRKPEEGILQEDIAGALHMLYQRRDAILTQASQIPAA